MAFELAIPVSAGDHVLGAAGAPVTVVEYGDFECPNCKQAAPAVKLLLQKFAGRVRFVYRHFPLEGVHPHALHAALAAEAAGAQGRFWPMHDLLFENQSHLKLPQLRRYAERLDSTWRATTLRWRKSAICSGCASISRAARGAGFAARPASSLTVRSRTSRSACSRSSRRWKGRSSAGMVNELFVHRACCK
jgi:hypothetical protein